ncbi:MAG: chemotaxis protein CheW [Gammaproteobacteria bacterium]
MTTNSGAPEPGGAESHQVLTFVLGNETYGVDILRVQEIRGWSAVTKIPHAPAHVLGVLNLRGSIVRSSTCACASTSTRRPTPR